MVSFLVAPDEAIKADEANKVRSNNCNNYLATKIKNFHHNSL